MIQNKYAQLSILSILHFLVDFICVGWVIFWCKVIYEEDIIFFLLFNYCCFAFLSQPFFGNYIDKLLERKNKDISKSILLISASLIFIGFAILSIVNPDAFYSRFPVIFIGVAFLGLGNSLFHVIGGKLTLSMSSKATFGGIFVSTGAIGVGLGTGIVYFTYTPTVTFSLAPFMYALGCLLMCFLIKDDKANVSLITQKDVPSFNKEVVISIIVLCLAILVRSFLGSYVILVESYTNIEKYEIAIFVGIATFVGKALGGFLYDYFGPIVLVSFSTVVTTLLGVFLPSIGFGICFVIAFNLLMPLTLHEIRKYFPNKEGFAFGLTAALLIPGYLLGTYLKSNGGHLVIVPLICFLTGILLLVMYLYRKYKKVNEGHN